VPDSATSTDPAVQAQLDRLTILSPGRDVLGLERISALMDRLGNPHRSLPPVFHVAGTNGKGSTCAFLRAALEAAGYRVHVYTSPHLVRFNERIRVAGRLIEDAALAPLLAEVLDCSEDIAPSFFEATTAAAFLAFARTPADACVIEVGLGGRLDATNVIERPLVCGIAALGIDHREFLLSPDPELAGMSELERIGFEKAGIAKPGVPLVTMSCDPEATEGIGNQADRSGAHWLPQGPAWRIRPRNADEVGYVDQRGNRGRQKRLILPRPSLAGRHQIDNAGLAIAMLRHQDRLTVSKEAISKGLQSARWPARLQRLSPGPLAGSRTVWLDGGHNESAGREIYIHFYGAGGVRHSTLTLTKVEKLACSDPMEAAKLLGIEFMHLIIGMLTNKDPMAIVKPLSPFLASLTAVPIPGHKHHPPESFGEDARSADDVGAALAALPDDGLPVLIAGSLYLAGEVLRLNGELPD
jgi:dihydrofolate synthase / folylpolyglutamate synthase